jgi:hypothetical protein
MPQTIADQIADLIHETFKYAHGGFRDITGIVGASQPSGDVRHELMLCAAQLKRQNIDAELLSKVDANVRTSHVMGLITDETHNKIIDLLGEV